MKFTIDKNILLENLSNVIKGISTKNVIPVLNGIKFDLTDNGLSLTASDSELTINSFIEAKEIKNIEQTGTIIIQSKFILDIIRKLPSDVINLEVIDRLKIRIYTENAQFSLNCLDAIELEKIITDEDDVYMHIFNNKVLFKYKNIKFQTNLLSGTYPNTSNLIPSEYGIIVKMNKNEFSSSVDRAALLTQGKDKNIIKMKLENKVITINSYASEIGKVEEKLIVDTDNASNIDISFSSKYMLEALRTIKEDEILLLMTDDVKPIVIKSVTDESLIQLILPIKTY